MRRKGIGQVVGIAVVAIGATIVTLVGDIRPVLGLDLQGGVSVVLQPVKAGKKATKVSQEALEQTQAVIETRVNAIGVAEPEIAIQGDTIVVQLPGVENQKRVLALVGKTDNQCATMNMCDISFFATTGDGYIKGSVAKKIQGLPGLPVNQYSFTSSCGGQYGWNSVDDCCIGCTDLAFTICADPCKILIDNGSQISAVAQFASGAPSEKSVSNSSRNTRAADDFVINPCRDFSVCYIEGCVYTNCEGWDGFYEIYANDCKLPDFYFGDSVVAYKDGATKIVDLGYNVVIGGVTLRAYRVEFHDISGLILQKGHTYWISIGALDTFSFTEKAYFCCNYDCRRIGCLTRFNRGVKLTTAQQGSHPSTPVGWIDAGCDFAFLIAGTYAGTAPGSGSVGTACIADIDGNGSVGVADLFTFLDAWFAGCP